MDGPLFFISYARNDLAAPTADIRRFYADLSTIIRQRCGPFTQDESPGFIDVAGVQPGNLWPDVLADALRTARAFIPVFSPTYFSSQYCGKEWTAFTRRLSEGPVSSMTHTPLQPVILVPPADLRPIPVAVADYQFWHDDYPPQYLKRGLSYLMNVPGESDTYWRFLHAFADKLIDAIRNRPLDRALEVEPLSTIPSAFHDAQSQHQVVLRGGPPSRYLFAQFVYVVARSDELRSLRQELSPYGEEGGLDWRPYVPQSDAEIGMMVAQIASRERFRYEPIPLDDHLAERIAAAAGARKVVVVVVDVWTARLERYRRAMEELDNRNVPTCVIVAPVNLDDLETIQSRELLQATLEATFVNHHLAPDPDSFLTWIESPESLDAHLSAALGKAKMRILRHYEVTRRAEAMGAFSRLPTIMASDQSHAS